MPARNGPISRARRAAIDDHRRVLDELGRARRAAGVSDVDLGRACGMSRWVVARTLSGTRQATPTELAVIGAALGLHIRLRAYPAGDPIRDVAQQRLLERLRVRLAPGLGWRTEVPLPLEGDPRAWDAVVSGRGWRVAVEAETVVEDVQALERRFALKRRDGGIDEVVLLIAETRRNRQAIRAAPSAFGDLDRNARGVLRALSDGTDPRGSALVFL